MDQYTATAALMSLAMFLMIVVLPLTIIAFSIRWVMKALASIFNSIVSPFKR